MDRRSTLGRSIARWYCDFGGAVLGILPAQESGLWHPDAIERALAHGEKDRVRATYHRGTHWAERVRMAQWWSDHLDQLRAGGAVLKVRFDRAWRAKTVGSVGGASASCKDWEKQQPQVPALAMVPLDQHAMRADIHLTGSLPFGVT